MTTLMIKDLSASKELDSKAMAAVAGGTADILPIVLSATSIATSFPVDNRSAQVGVQSNSVGAFNFGVVNQSNNQNQSSDQLGNLLGAVGGRREVVAL
jgi:hypothetical protein